jgi:hypothetical protein
MECICSRVERDITVFYVSQSWVSISYGGVLREHSVTP